MDLISKEEGTRSVPLVADGKTNGSRHAIDQESNQKVISNKLHEERCGESGPDGAMDKEAIKWEEMYKRLREFRNKNGHCLVCSEHEDRELASWVGEQRLMFRDLMPKSEKTTPKIKGQISKLNEIGFIWTEKRQSNCVPWEARFEELLEFVVQNGHTQVPIGWEENVQLSNWVSAQRQAYKAKQNGRYSRLTQPRIEMLNSIEFVWEATKGGPRRQRISNHVPVPQTYTTGCHLPPHVLQEKAKLFLKVFAQRRSANVSGNGFAVKVGEGEAVARNMTQGNAALNWATNVMDRPNETRKTPGSFQISEVLPVSVQHGTQLPDFFDRLYGTGTLRPVLAGVSFQPNGQQLLYPQVTTENVINGVKMGATSNQQSTCNTAGWIYSNTTQF